MKSEITLEIHQVPPEFIIIIFPFRILGTTVAFRFFSLLLFFLLFFIMKKGRQIEKSDNCRQKKKLMALDHYEILYEILRLSREKAKNESE